MKRTLINTFVICFCFTSFLFGPAWAAKADSGLTLSTKEVDINAFFSGKTLTVSGRIPATDDVIVEISGRETKSVFDLKGRKGLFWMTKGSVTLEHVPELYLMLCPNRLAGEQEPGRTKVCGRHAQDRKLKDQKIKDRQGSGQQAMPLGLGIEHIEQQAKVSGSVDVPQNIFDMFFALEKKAHLYNRIKGAVTYSDERNGTKKFIATCHLPALIDTGAFNVVATTLDHGMVKYRTKNTFEVKEVGFVKLVDHLSSDRRLAYGVTAVVIALFAGLVMALVFKQEG